MCPAISERNRRGMGSSARPGHRKPCLNASRLHLARLCNLCLPDGIESKGDRGNEKRGHEVRMRSVLLAVILILIAIRPATAIDPYAGNDPFWVLLHEPAVVKELKLSSSQKSDYLKLLDGLDLRFFPLRNQSREQVTEGFGKIISEVQAGLKTLLEAEQSTRLNQILFQFLGNSSLLRQDVSDELQLTSAQQKRMQQIASDAETAIAAIQKEAQKNGQKESTEKQYRQARTDEQKKLIAVLMPDQLERLKKLVGSPFPMDELRKPGFKAPELVNTNEWINSSPLALEQLKGKVVVVHFYACGCINCIHNYPTYRKWHDQFRRKDFVMIGIHTPETSAERVSAHVKSRATDEKLVFPILIDGKSENWNAWGNSMWPSVYLIDKRGYLRDFWAGELIWQGNDGEKYMREKIEGLLAE